MPLDRLFLSNPLRDWVIALAIAAAAYVALLLLHGIVVGRLAGVASRTETHIDDAMIAMARRTRWFFFGSMAAIIALPRLLFPERVEERIRMVLGVLLLLQVGLWLGGLIEFLTTRALARRRAADDRLGVATVRALAVGTKVLAWIVLVVVALRWALGLDVTLLVTSLGVGGIALALAVQQILGDVLAAIAIVFDKPFDVGEAITVDSFAGTVEHIGLKTTRVRSVNGELVIFSNADLLKSRVQNFSRMVERRVVLPLEIDREAGPEAAARIPEIVERVVLSQSPVRFGRCHLAQITDSALRYECVYHVLDPDYAIFVRIQHAINLAVLTELTRAGIEMVRTQRVAMGRLP
jgi:small-conductance mechanosensitive channel